MTYALDTAQRNGGHGLQRQTLGGFIGALCLSACASEPATMSGSLSGMPEGDRAGSTAFRLQDFGWSKSPGQAAIHGVVAYEADPGGSYTCRGKDVVLLPETTWSRARVLSLYGSIEAAAVPLGVVRSRTIPAPSDYALVVRHASCDMANKFAFQDLPAGHWFVITMASPSQGASSPVIVMQRVETRRSVQQIALGKPS